MNITKKPLNIYLMGIGGSAMGAFAGLLKQSGHMVCGSDQGVYSPMKEKLNSWGIKYQTPYHEENLKKNPDLVIIGNVIKKDNPEAQKVLSANIPYDSFPHALKKIFLQEAIPMIVTGTHGKTTTSALIAHTLKASGRDLGYLIGGIPQNYCESFLSPKFKNSPFVLEGDEYDTAFFDKSPKFMHYMPKFLLTTCIEYDHADIYNNLNEILHGFKNLYQSMKEDQIIIINSRDENIKKIANNIKPKIFSYGSNGDYKAEEISFSQKGIHYKIRIHNTYLGQIFLPLFGEHNLENSLGAYAMLHQYGLSHKEIALGFSSFLGVKRRLEEIGKKDNIILVDDFAHHPTAIRETLKAAKQKYLNQEIHVIFEARSATSCRSIFQEQYPQAFKLADKVFLGPAGRKLSKDIMLDQQKIAQDLKNLGTWAKTYENYQTLFADVFSNTHDRIILVMTNGDLMSNMDKLKKMFT